MQKVSRQELAAREALIKILETKRGREGSAVDIATGGLQP
jgi:hypothetical protein